MLGKIDANLPAGATALVGGQCASLDQTQRSFRGCFDVALQYFMQTPVGSAREEGVKPSSAAGRKMQQDPDAATLTVLYCTAILLYVQVVFLCHFQLQFNCETPTKSPKALHDHDVANKTAREGGRHHLPLSNQFLASLFTFSFPLLFLSSRGYDP